MVIPSSCYFPDVEFLTSIQASLTWLICIMQQLLRPLLSSRISFFFSFTFWTILLELPLLFLYVLIL